MIDHELVHITDHRGHETVLQRREFEVAQAALSAAKHLPAIQRYLQPDAALGSNGNGRSTRPSITELEDELRRRVTQPAPEIAQPVDHTNALSFREWAKAIEGHLPPGKTKGYFKKARPDLKKIVDALPGDADRALLRGLQR